MAPTLGCAGVAAQVCYPLSHGALRDVVTVAVVVLLAGACLAHAASTRGARWAVGLVSITVGGGMSAEFVGTHTGMPFGRYEYTAAGALGWEVGSVPLVIGPAWMFGTYLAWCAAQALVGPGRGAGLRTVLAATCGLVGWDLYLDPQMVADGRWAWVGGGPGLPGVPEVPLSNYAGWLLVALVFCTALHGLDRLLRPHTPQAHTPQAHTPRAPGAPSDSLPVMLFCWLWLGSALAHAAFLGLPVSAGYGLVGMGIVGAPLLVRLLGRAR